MRTTRRAKNQSIVCALAFLLCEFGTAWADGVKAAYSTMAPIEQYRMASASEEIALSRSAAPASISGDASVLIFGTQGYETAVKGKSGFVCLVERSWASGYDDAGFWNSKLRAPMCLNPAAARTILPNYLKRTEWVIAGASKSDMIGRSRAELAANRIKTPEPGAMSFMLSKPGYLGDLAGHWHAHLMFFFSRIDGANWGADLHGSPVVATQDDSERITTLMVLVPAWSDGTPSLIESH
jgi:hypothetical protein